MSAKEEITNIDERLKDRCLYRSSVNERIRRALVRQYGKQKAKEVKIKDLD